MKNKTPVNDQIESIDLKIKELALKNDAERFSLEKSKSELDKITGSVGNAFNLSLMACMTHASVMGEKRLYTDAEVLKIKAKVFRLIKDI